MSTIQHMTAEKLLPIIVEAAKQHKTLTYQTAAEKLGRPKDNARMVAQVCDLLDAAAAYAAVPLLALIVVREKSGKINRNAWKSWGDREAIINCSSQHKFTNEDFGSIKAALFKLRGKSNIMSWRSMRETISDNEIVRRLTNGTRLDFLDAIDDVGTDVPERFISLVASYARDPKIRDAVKARANGKCEFCGEIAFITSDGRSYLECHHIVALANDGADRMNNVIALCPNDHREAHFGKRKDKIEKEMIRKIRSLQ